MIWNKITALPSKKFKCGHCGREIASKEGYIATTERFNTRTSGQYYTTDGWIYICHFCENPTYFNHNDNQFPGAAFGTSIKHISDSNVNSLFEEARKCHSFKAYTSSVICCRKLLMNISVSEGAKEGIGFRDYITYLDDNGFVPPKGKPWVDKIRELGNEANHKIDTKSEKDSKMILHFTSMLLRFIYEMPGLMQDSED